MRDIHRSGLPTRAVLGPHGLHLELKDIAPGDLRDPFMQETVKRVPARSVRIEIPRARLGGAEPDGMPAGVIFHVARCGSTLASQLLKLGGDVVVYAEPLPVNEILLPPHKWNREDLVGALRAVGAAFARHAGRPYVLKLTSWTTFYCDLVAAAFPQAPWALCIRDPVEVCVSLSEHAPGWLGQSGPAAAAFASVIDPARASRTREDYLARAVGGLCDAAARLDVGRGALVRYEALPQAVWEVLAPHFSIAVDDDLRRRMSDAARGYSKAPVGEDAEFVADSSRKRAAASPRLLASVDAYARPALERVAGRFRTSS